ncbi:MAG: insulinase family protein [Clostridia bacterium]|nr:insulinase family protein [Clostridia bacterium]MDD4375292.1 insulinase family protein [Clostridia bacterium]
MDNKVILINDNKFKGIFLSVNLMRPLNVNENSKNALVASILKRGNEKHLTEKDLEERLAELYSSKIDINVERCGGIYNIEFSAEIINKKFINNDILDEVIDILHSVIYKPCKQNGKFYPEYFCREKQNLIDKIKEEKNEKRKWALKRLEQEMFKNSDYRLGAFGSEEDVRKIELEECYLHYEKLLEEADIRIVMVGNLEGYDNIEEKLTSKFNIQGKRKEIEKTKIEAIKEFKEIKEKEMISQSVLCMGLSLKEMNTKDIMKAYVYSNILGGTPSSKLFQNVREKESLAYYAKAEYIKHINAIYVFSGIHISNVEKATEVIRKQIDDIKQGKITEEEFSTAKANLILGYKEITDNRKAYSRHILSNSLIYKNIVDTKKQIAEIESISLADIISLADKVEEKTLYLLGGMLDE